MRNADLAERLLALVASDDRAAAMTGDLVELSVGRGALWFWRAVGVTALQMIGRDLAASPWFFTLLTLHAAVRAFLLTVIGLLLVVVAVAVMSLVFSGAPDLLERVRALGNRGVLPVVVSYFIGRWVGRKAHGRELSACAVLMASNSTLGLASGFLRHASTLEIAAGLAAAAIPYTAMLGGALLVRSSTRRASARARA